MESVLSLVENLGTELEHGVLVERASLNAFPACLTPCFNGGGFDCDASGQESSLRQLCLMPLDAGDKFGVAHCSTRFIDGQHFENGYEIFFRFIPRDSNGHHKAEVVA